jgi:hypothetical protein
MSRTPPSRIALAAGFTAFLLALLVAVRNPATGYELSIYDATPVTVWALLAAALLVSLAVALYSGAGRWDRRGALLLASLVAFAFVSVPTIRGYYYPGLGDPLSHLGWISEVGSGALDPTGLLYPGAHTVAIVLADLAGLSYRVAAQLTVLAFVAVYLLAFPLTVRATTTRRGAFLVGLLVALLWLPLNGISVHLSFHPFSLGVLFLPFVVYLAAAYVVQRRPHAGWIRPPTRIGVLLAFATAATVLVHPQVGVLLVVVLGTATGLQHFLRRLKPDHPIAAHRSLHGQTAFAAVVSVLWLGQFTLPLRIVASTVSGLLGGRAAGSEVSQRGASLAELGGSLGELFVKLFLPTIVVVALVGAFLLLRWTGRGGRWFRGATALVDYFAVAAVPLGVLFVLTYVAGVTTQHFRYLGAATLLVALVGAAAVATLGRPTLPSARSPATAAALVLVVALVPVSAMTLYSSPYIYQPSGHVTEAQMDGYATTIEHRADGVGVTGIRGSYHRYIDALLGREGSRGLSYEARRGISGTVFSTNLSTFATERWYLPVTRLDYEREVVLYDGFRYARSGFRALESSPTIHRVQSNGGVVQYLLTPPNGSA